MPAPLQGTHRGVHLGYADQALQRSQEALRLAQELSHPFSLVWALYFATSFHHLRREGQAAQERAEALITLSTEQGFPFYLALGAIFRGRALVEQGQAEEGMAQMRQGLAAYRATRAELSRPGWLVMLAEAYGKVGQTEEGLTVLAEALAMVHKTDRVVEADLYRLKGELLLKSKVQGPKSKVSDPRSLTPGLQSEAEKCFRQAIDIARRQSAKSLELRATTSLARLLQKQGKKEEARCATKHKDGMDERAICQ